MAASENVKVEVSSRPEGYARQLERAVRNPAVAVDNPYICVRYLLLHYLYQFELHNNGQQPKTIHIPPMLEAALQIDYGRNLKIHGRIRDIFAKEFLGCRPVWDAVDLKVE